ncbi:MAG: hypothetical protein JWO78_188 [Micavibrio sp.]|nr:hypothetical protein [Micavibrio sp.]
MLFNFTVNYRSGRQEVLKTKSGLVAKNMRADLAKAKETGGVSDWSEEQISEKKA